MADQTPEQVAAAAEAETAKAAENQKITEAMVQGAVRSSIEAMVKEGQNRQAEVEALKAAETAGKMTPGPFDEVIRPTLEPVLKAAKDAETRATLAADSVNFYTDPANAVALKYRAKIEGIVAEQLKRGHIVARSDAWKYLRGGELYDELGKETLTAHEAKLREAREASAAGPSTTVPKFTKPVDEMKTDELGEALRGVTF